MPVRLPHPIPYQGSKRNLAPLIGPHLPRSVDTWFEPFAGSAAMTLWAAHHGIAKRYVIGDILPAISDLWTAIILSPKDTAARYREVWEGQEPGEAGYFNHVRARYNAHRDPVDLLYLTCRCVKNAIRFNRKGAFTQSVDKRRLGMRPERMQLAITGASVLLKGQAEVLVGDWMFTNASAGAGDFVYMDPPYFGTTVGRDKRYVEGLDQDRLVAGLRELLDRRIPFVLSYDGMTGEKVYRPPLPESLGLSRILLHAGVSSQATLAGRFEETVESLYLSPGVGTPTPGIIRRPKAVQESLAI